MPRGPLALVLSVLLTVAACGGGDATTETTPAPETTTTEGSTATTAAEETTTTADPAADYPEGPITWIVSFDPGGGSDTEARRIQQSLEEILGTRVQIEYRSGGGGAVGWSELVKTEPDGYTVGGLVIPHIVIQPLALDDPGYATTDMRAVAWTVGAPAALLVSEDSPFQTLEEFVAFALENPGELTVGGVSTYSGSDLALAEFVQAAGIDVSYVPITGGAAPIITDLLGGHIDAAMLATTHAVRNGDAGVRPLAIAGDTRFAGLPDVATFSESGYDVTVRYAWGVGVPADVPDAFAIKFGEAVIQAMQDSGAADAVVNDGLDPIMIGPDEAQAWVDSQMAAFESLLPVLADLHAG